MQRCNATLRLGGSLLHTVFKTDLSPAEIVVLRSIHGSDCLVDIVKTEQDKMPHSQERARLIGLYGMKVMEKLFPGYTSRLPVYLEDIEDIVVPPAEAEADEPEPAAA